jgi:hypothetical protein
LLLAIVVAFIAAVISDSVDVSFQQAAVAAVATALRF